MCSGLSPPVVTHLSIHNVKQLQALLILIRHKFLRIPPCVPLTFLLLTPSCPFMSQSPRRFQTHPLSPHFPNKANLVHGSKLRHTQEAGGTWARTSPIIVMTPPLPGSPSHRAVAHGPTTSVPILPLSPSPENEMGPALRGLKPAMEVAQLGNDRPLR